MRTESNPSMRNYDRPVMIVDDDPGVLITLKTFLVPAGFNVELYEEAEKALDNFVATKYILLILDVKMPKMSGFELYHLIRKLDPAVKACFLTGLDDFTEFNAFKKEIVPKFNERFYVQKPIAREDFLERISYMTETHNIDYTTEKGRSRANLLDLTDALRTQM